MLVKAATAVSGASAKKTNSRSSVSPMLTYYPVFSTISARSGKSWTNPARSLRSFYDSLSQGESVGEAVQKREKKLIEAHGEETIVWATTCFMAIRPLHSTPPKRKKK
jgi:hypothetical protein